MYTSTRCPAYTIVIDCTDMLRIVPAVVVMTTVVVSATYSEHTDILLSSNSSNSAKFGWAYLSRYVLFNVHKYTFPYT